MKPLIALLRLPAGLFLLAALLSACAPQAPAHDPNPPAPGFDQAGSDSRAIALADTVMKVLGGREAWDRARYLEWNFFGNRKHIWDKHAGRARIEAPREGMVFCLDLDSLRGSVYRQGREITQPDSLRLFLEMARNFWINDSYWLVMPYKLKDSGVTLRYAGQDQDSLGRPADVLELRFAGVGVTPENKYRVWVDRRTRLVSQWAYYRSAADSLPRIVTPWADWEEYQGIKLSGNRGGNRQLSGIAVHSSLPDSLFRGW